MFSGFISSRHLRAIGVFLALAGLLVLPGCWVTSISGLSEQGLWHGDPDLIFNEGMIGTWQETSDNCLIVLTVTAKDRIYTLHTIEQGDNCDDKGKTYHNEAELFKLGDHLFLDVWPEDLCEPCLALHWIFLVRLDGNSLSLTPIDSDWLKNAMEQGTVTLTTMPGDTDTLTASPRELKAFCRKYADDKSAFKPDPGLVFKKK
jgi:hypothetical protein